MKAKLSILVAIFLFAVSPLSNAFVSYGDSAPVTGVEPGLVSRVETLGHSVAKLNPAERYVFVSAPCKNQVGVTDRDVAPDKIPGVSIGGNNVPLGSALRTILPRGWHADKESAVDHNLRLSWEASNDFTSALSNIAIENKLSIQISWLNKRVHVRAGCENKPQNVTQSVLDVGMKDKKEQLAAPAPASIALNAWTLITDKTLKENLHSWSQKAGWHLVWKIKDTDFRVTHSTTINGSFTEAVEQLITAYENGNTPISANFYDKDRVIEVVDHTPFKRNTIQ